jgi:MraZ protein
MVFPRPAWETFRDKVAALPMSAAGWKRIFLGNAMDVEVDSAARVLVSPELRAAAGLTKDVMLLGMGSHFELWDAQRYAAHEAEVMAQPMPEVLQDFTF